MTMETVQRVGSGHAVIYWHRSNLSENNKSSLRNIELIISRHNKRTRVKKRKISLKFLFRQENILDSMRSANLRRDQMSQQNEDFERMRKLVRVDI